MAGGNRHTKKDLEKLHDKAKEYVDGGKFYDVHWFYRDKTPAYFQEILDSDDKVMKKYIKDENGDPKSPINGQIKGLFFAVNVGRTTGLPYKPSAFGSRRLKVPVAKMVEVASKLYFADFYCMNSRAHWVTLVMTAADTEEDLFCQDNLVSLHPDTNPFFRLPATPEGPATVQGSKRFWVEILVTEDFDIGALLEEKVATLDDVIKTSNRRHGGRHKKPNCQVCNI